MYLLKRRPTKSLIILSTVLFLCGTGLWYSRWASAFQVGPGECCKTVQEDTSDDMCRHKNIMAPGCYPGNPVPPLQQMHDFTLLYPRYCYDGEGMTNTCGSGSAPCFVRDYLSWTYWEYKECINNACTAAEPVGCLQKYVTSSSTEYVTRDTCP
jgi:hypothetical protein